MPRPAVNQTEDVITEEAGDSARRRLIAARSMSPPLPSLPDSHEDESTVRGSSSLDVGFRRARGSEPPIIGDVLVGGEQAGNETQYAEPPIVTAHPTGGPMADDNARAPNKILLHYFIVALIALPVLLVRLGLSQLAFLAPFVVAFFAILCGEYGAARQSRGEESRGHDV